MSESLEPFPLISKDSSCVGMTIEAFLSFLYGRGQMEKTNVMLNLFQHPLIPKKQTLK